MLNLIQKLTHDRKGVTSVEYGLIAALVAAGLMIAVPGVVTSIKTAFTTIGTDITPAA